MSLAALLIASTLVPAASDAFSQKAGCHRTPSTRLATPKAFAATPGSLARPRPAPFLRRRGAGRGLASRARDPNIPMAIIEAEKNANPQRPLRFAGYSLFGAYGLAVILANTGVLPDIPGELTLAFFDSEQISAAVGVVAVLLASYFANADIDQREKNIERIWAEVQRRKESGTLASTTEQAGSPSSATPAAQGKGKGKKKKKKGAKGFASAASTSAPPAPAPRQPSAEPLIGKPEKQEQASAPSSGGLFGNFASNMKDTVDQANVLARVQALQVNEALEDAGVLPKLNASRPTRGDK